MATPVAQYRNWWALALRGVLAILFGLVLLIWPGVALFTLTVLAVLFGAYALIDGILAFAAMVKGIQQHTEWWPHFLEGVLGITAAALVFIWTGLTATVLLYVIAVWAVFTGIFKAIPAISRGEWLMVASGLVSVVFGLLLVAYASSSIETVIPIIGVFAVVFGILLLGQAFQLTSGVRGE